ncbi:hypothetical protein [Paraliobacillus ryukyuensis]|uniref:hypothetical protein n=1 Tax=Paraliobacillus ryukyuensis TaxID=200904 RepID=UPI0009A7740C|nr:hypothetical protein [Paraliobacillus ryukyuensis]
MDELSKLVNAKVIGITKNNEILFDNEMSIDVNPYETYVYRYYKDRFKRSELAYYSPSEFPE